MKKLYWLVCFISLSSACFGAPDNIWTWRNPSPTGNTLKAVAYGSTLQFSNFVAVDNAGCIYASTNGLNWTQQFVGTNTLTSVCFGNGSFVAAGGTASGGGMIVLSQDGGFTWQPNYTVTNFLNAVAFGNNEFVAIGNGGAIGDSEGYYWTNENNSSVPGGMNGIAWGDSPGVFLAVGNGGNMSYTYDGVNWNNFASATTTYQLNAVTWGGGNLNEMEFDYGYFVAVGESVITTSVEDNNFTDNEWSLSSSTDFGTAVTYNAASNTFVSVDIEHQPSTYVSTNNGSSFADANSSSNIPYADGITYGNGIFVMVGNSGQTAVSMNASNWTLSATPPTTQPLACGAFRPSSATYGPNLFVVGGGTLGGSGVILRSPDGTNWTQDTSTSASRSLEFTVPSGFVYANGQFVASATEYNGSEAGIVLLSTNGTAWTNYTAIASHSLNAIAYGGGAYVAVGSSGAVPYSSNGSNWTANTLAAGFIPSLNGVIFAKNEFVAVGGSGLSAVSTNGINWTTNYSAYSTNLNAVAYGNGVLVAVGGESYDYNAIFTSYDGLNWTQQTNFSTLYTALSSVTYFGGYFFTAGGGGDVFVSYNGTNWWQDMSGTANNLSCVFAGDSQVLALGASGTILGDVVGPPSSPPAANAVYSPTEGFSFTIVGTPGQSILVESSTDLVNWTIFQNIPGGGTVQITDPSLLSSSKWYRFLYTP